MDFLVAAQVQEMELVRQKVYNLEQNQIAIKQRWVSHICFSMVWELIYGS